MDVDDAGRVTGFLEKPKDPPGMPDHPDLSLASMGLRWPAIALGALMIAAGLSPMKLPSGFVPNEDQGYFFSVFNLPDGASMERTDELMRRAEADLKTIPGVGTSRNMKNCWNCNRGWSTSAGKPSRRCTTWAASSRPTVSLALS